jgi:hypothetical protein
MRGVPIYKPGDQHVMLLEKLWNPRGSLYSTVSIFDVYVTEEGEFLFKRGHGAYDEIPRQAMRSGDPPYNTAVKGNHPQYTQKCTAEDLVAAVKEARRKLKNKPAATP